jgi:hypothetical protein
MPEKSSAPAYAIAPQGPRQWDIRVNGIPMDDLLAAYARFHGQQPQPLAWLTASHASLGTTYTYGTHPNASPPTLYDGMWKHERLGGGSVIVPYVEDPAGKQIYIGLLLQWRKLHNAHQAVLGVPRGFALADEQPGQALPLTRQQIEEIHIQTAYTELGEEMFTGVLTPDMLHPLGPPVNTNNADVDTSGEGEGIYFYRIELPWHSLTAAAGRTFSLKEAFLSRQGRHEGIVGCHFCRLVEVLDMLDDPANTLAGCSLTEIAIARLTRYLQRNGRQII